MADATPLLRVLRGDHLESIHRGSIVVVEGEETVFTRGDPAQVVFYRSTSKPHQALVAVTAGAVDALGISPAELALAAGSHNSAPDQVALARSILHKAGLDESALGCGGHFSLDAKLARRQRAERDTPLPVWDNCSGKHALMLATTRHLGHDVETYLDVDHPVQAEIRRHVAAFCGIDAPQVRAAVDGCGTPAFAVPLDAMALSLARFGSSRDVPDDLARAARRTADAMSRYPEMVGGEGRFDTDLMRTASERLIAKAGAEGTHGVFAPDRGIGLAVSVEDGADRGYRLVVVAMLERLGLLGPDEAETIRRLHCDPTVRDRKGVPVGRLEVCLNT